MSAMVPKMQILRNFKSYAPFLCKVRNYYNVKSDAVLKTPENAIARQIYARIKTSGPLTVADYMKEVLINPCGGYYAKGEGIGQGGDFITSPELGQVFGEMVAIWFLNEWSKSGSPKPFQIVELGPGKGTLMQDILRVFDHFQSLQSASIQMVELSQQLSAVQAMNLCMKNEAIYDKDSVIYRQGITKEGVPIKWYTKFTDVPQVFTLLVAHEFFDALPIHKFQKTKEGYREILIDIDETSTNETATDKTIADNATNKTVTDNITNKTVTDDITNKTKEYGFRYVIAKNPTPASKLFIDKDETREHLEVSPDSLVLSKEIAQRLTSDGGLALIADYGHEGTGTDTFRAFKKHKPHDPLVEPGSADLTADVDFSMLKRAAIADDGVLAFGPVSQRDFLHRLGAEHRVKSLKKTVNEKQHEALDFSYHMMTDKDKMGSRFKFLSFVPKTLEKILKKYPVVGFH